MNVSNEQQVSEEALVRALRATRANDAEAAPRRHRRQTDQCPSLARFAAVRKAGSGPGETWTAAEFAHVRGCAFCQSLSRLFNAATTAVDASGELTVSGTNANEDTQTGAPLPAKKSGTTAKPTARPPAE